jgi:hypothetical protein
MKAPLTSEAASLTMGRIRELLLQFPPIEPDPLITSFLRPRRFAGLEVFEAPPAKPVLEVRDIKYADGTSILSAEFRTRLNAWLLERFGRQEDHFTHYAYTFGHTLVMRDSRRILGDFIV